MATKTKSKKANRKPTTKKHPRFYILWCPTSDKPPRVRYATLTKAKEIANKMAVQYGSQFYVMGSFFSVERKTRVPEYMFVMEDHSGKENPNKDGKDFDTYRGWQDRGRQVMQGSRHRARSGGAVDEPLFHYDQTEEMDM